MKYFDIFRPFMAGVSTLCVLLFSSCLDDDSLEQDDTFEGNFEACWQTLDEHYCFFKEKGVDWDFIHDYYKPLFRDSIKTQYQLFDVLDDMLDLLRDGHVNVYTPFNTARYWGWYENYLDNYDSNLVSTYYLGNDYWYTSGMQFGCLPDDSVGYIRYSSFANTIGDTNLDYVLAMLSTCNGLILDIRNNGGGSLTNAVTLAQRFATKRILYGYIRHKTGTGHSDFSDPEPLYLDPTENRITWNASLRPVVVLTNRHCYSAANNFVQIMQALDGTMTPDSLGQPYPKLIKICGDRTGGGGGMPFESVLPNGWTLRFSACPILDYLGQCTEEGIDPSDGLRVDMDSLSTFLLHRDDIIEAARAYILSHTRAPRKSSDSSSVQERK